LAYRVGGDLGFDNLHGIWDEIERVSPVHAGVTNELLAGRSAKDGVVVPLGGTSGSPVAPSPLDPMAEPGIIAAETNWVSLMTSTLPGADQAGEVEHTAEGHVGRADTLKLDPAGAVQPMAGSAESPAAGPDAGRAPGGDAGSAPDADAAPTGAAGGGSAPDADAAPTGAAGGAAAPAAGDAPAAGSHGRPALLRLEPPATMSPAPPLDAYSLRLISSRRLWDAGTLVQNSPHLAGLAPPLRLRANPHDVERLGLRTGGRVKVVSPRAVLVLEVEVDAGVPRGSAAVDFNLGDEGAADLIDASAAVNNVRLDTV